MTGADKDFVLNAGQTADVTETWHKVASGNYAAPNPYWPHVKATCLGTGLIDFFNQVEGWIDFATLGPGVSLNSLNVEAKSSLQFDMKATLHPATDVTSYCTALAGSSGVPSTLEAYGAPVRGQPAFVVRLKNAPAASTAMLVLATGQSNTPFGTFFACLSGMRLSSSPVIIPNAAGTHDFTLILNAATPGTTVYAQAFLREAGTGTTLSTQGLAIAVLP